MLNFCTKRVLFFLQVACRCVKLLVRGQENLLFSIRNSAKMRKIRTKKNAPPPTVGHTVGRERRKKNVCTGSDYFFCAFTGAAGCSTSAL